MLICNVAFSQIGWFQQSSGTNLNFETVCFINDQTGFVSGSGFTIFKTTNGGVSWTQTVLIDTCSIYAIRFLNNSTGYACGGKPVNEYYSLQFLYYTNDAGVNWIRIYMNAAAFTYMQYNDVFPINSSVYLASSGYSVFNSAGSLIVSQNNGTNFTPYFSSNESIEKFSFINSQTGWYSSTFFTDLDISQRKIYKTTNSGINWSMQYRDSTREVNWFGLDFELQFVNLNTGYGLYKRPGVVKFVKTSNSGTTWDSISLPYNKYRGMIFSDTNTGWICGESSSDSVMIIKTTNSGTNWTIQAKGNYTITSMSFINNLTGWAVGYNGVILKTITGGITLASQTSSEIPSAYSLGQNYPNPFNPVTKIRFDVRNGFPIDPRPETSWGLGNDKVVLKIYDALGREVETLVNEQLAAGTYEVTFDGSMYPSGMYFYKLTADSFSETKRMALLK